jgi:hypothetical protein
MPTTATKSKRGSKSSKKSASTRAGEYVREEMHSLKRGSSHVKSRKQAIAVGLSRARKKGVRVPRKRSAS